MLDIDPFRDQIKPSMFAPQVDTRSKKSIEIEDGSDYYGVKPGQSFEKTVQQVSDVLGRDFNRVQSGGYTTAADEAAANQKLGKQIMGQRTISKVYEGFSFLPQDVMANVEQMKSSYNFERVSDPDYVYLPNILKPQYLATKDQASLEAELYDQRFFDQISDNPGDEATSPHNLNLFHGIGSNPVKEGDTVSYERFQKSPYFSALHSESMTPRNILEKLDPQFWAMINEGIDHLTTSDVSGLSKQELSQFRNPYGADHEGLNWRGIADPYTDSRSTTFDINANFHTVVSSQIWQTWDDRQTFMFVNRLWESSNRVDDVLREIIGKSSDMPTFPSSGDSGATTVTAENAAKEVKMTDNVQKWWDKVGSGLNEAEVLPFGLLMTFTPLMQTMKDWGNWANQIESSAGLKKDGDQFGFKEKMIQGYLNYSASEYVFKKFRGNGRISPAVIGADTQKLSEAIYADLVSKGYVNPAGVLTDKFDASNPDFVLNINFSDSEKGRVRDVLRQAAVGSFSLDVQDKTLVNGQRRSDIRIPGADGNLYTLTNLVDLIRSGSTPYDQIKNAQMSYNTLFDMHAMMTGLDQGVDTNGNPIITTKGAQSQVTVSKDGTWNEWDSKTSSWVQKKGPVNLSFSTPEDAAAFKDQIRVLLALLEPIVGTFGPDQTEGGAAFRILVDNSGSSDSVDMITDQSENYRLSVDTLYDKNLFSSDIWKRVSNGLQNKVVGVLQDSIFGKSEINSISRNRHKKKKENYEEAKYDYEQTEIKRMVTEMEEKSKRTQEEKQQEQRVKEEQIKAQNESQKRQDEERARRAQEDKRKK